MFKGPQINENEDPHSLLLIHLYNYFKINGLHESANSLLVESSKFSDYAKSAMNLANNEILVNYPSKYDNFLLDWWVLLWTLQSGLNPNLNQLLNYVDGKNDNRMINANATLKTTMTNTTKMPPPTTNRNLNNLQQQWRLHQSSHLAEQQQPAAQQSPLPVSNQLNNESIQDYQLGLLMMENPNNIQKKQLHQQQRQQRLHENSMDNNHHINNQQTNRLISSQMNTPNQQVTAQLNQRMLDTQNQSNNFGNQYKQGILNNQNKVGNDLLLQQQGSFQQQSPMVKQQQVQQQLNQQPQPGLSMESNKNNPSNSKISNNDNRNLTAKQQRLFNLQCQLQQERLKVIQQQQAPLQLHHGFINNNQAASYNDSTKSGPAGANNASDTISPNPNTINNLAATNDQLKDNTEGLIDSDWWSRMGSGPGFA